MLRKIPVCLLFCLAACTIIPDDALEDFPKDVRVNQLTVKFLNEDTGEYKHITVKPVLTTNKIEITWPADIDIFFYNKNLVKTTYLLNNAGYATKITTSYADGKEIVDELVYDGNNRVTELKNSFFNENLKFYYLNSQLDSISKIRTLPNMTTQSGFYKRVDESNFVSIFPFNKAQSYSLNRNFHGSCECTSNAPVPNELNKTGYTFSNLSDSYYNQFYTDNNYIQFLNNQYCKQVFTNSVFEGGKNFYSKPRYLDSFASYCYSTSNDNYINSYLLFPGVIPDFTTLYLATIDNEVRWINSNTAKTSKWSLAGIDYGYAPSSK
jgi:hypothetical protein